MRIAKLENGILIGARNVPKPVKGDIPIGDLPADGSYRWDGECFRSVKPKGKRTPAVSRDEAVYLALTALLEERPIPHECRIWCDWYKGVRDGAG